MGSAHNSVDWILFPIALLVSVCATAAWSETDVSGQIQVSRGRPLYDFDNSQTYTDITITNISQQTLYVPIKLVIDSISTPQVSVANPDGYTSNNKPFIEFSAMLGDEVLSPAETSAAQTLRFDNPNRLRFNFTTILLAEIEPIPVNHPPIANAGADLNVFVNDTTLLDGSASSDVDADQLSYQWRFVSKPVDSNAILLGTGTVNAKFVPDIVGTYIVELVVNDGTVDSVPDPVTVTAAAIPTLSITITEPAEGTVFGNSPITVRGTVSDLAARVAIEDLLVPVTAGAFEASEVVITEGENYLTARTRNDRGQEAEVTRLVTLDTRAPICNVLSPANRSLFTTPLVPMLGYVSDETNVSVDINGAAGTVDQRQFNGTVMLNGAENLINLTCQDAAGNTTTKQLTLYLDNTPLTIIAVSPSDGAMAIATNSTVSVTFSETIAADSATESAYYLRAGSHLVAANINVAADLLTATLTPIKALPPGTLMDVIVTTGVTDLAGNPLSSRFISSFKTAGDIAQPAVVIGEVYDDSRSLPLAGVSVTALAASSRQILASTQTDQLGRYLFDLGRSDVLVRASIPGFTTVERAIEVQGVFAQAIDARLTPLGNAQNVTALLGGEFNSSVGDSLTLLPGALDMNSTIRLTTVSPQGPSLRFPLGWTPLRIVDIDAAANFDPPASLAISVPANEVIGSSAIIARHDQASASWLVLSIVDLPAEGLLEQMVTVPGQYALLIADTGEGVPPAATIGSALAAGLPSGIPEGADGTGVVIPAVGLVSDPTPAKASVTITAPLALRSATVLSGDFVEQFVLRSGSQLIPFNTSQDLFVYRKPGDVIGKVVFADFPIAPSQVFNPLVASSGQITVSMVRRIAIARDLIGNEGGGVETNDGSRVIIPSGSLDQNVPVNLLRISSDQMPIPPPANMQFIGGLQLDLLGMLPSVPLSLVLGDAVSRVPTGTTVVVAEVRSVKQEQRLVFVSLARVEGNNLVTVAERDGVTLAGIRAGGRYGFYRYDGSLEILKGQAREENGRLDGLVIEVTDMPFVSVTNDNGYYTQISPSGVFTLVASAAVTSDQVSFTGSTGIAIPEIIVGTAPPSVQRITVRPPRIEGNFVGPVVIVGKPAPIIDDDALGNSSGNGNGIIEAGEKIELSLTVRNDGSVAIDNGFFVLGVQGPDGAINVTLDDIAIDFIAADETVEFGPFTYEVPTGIDPTSLRYTLTRFTDSGSRPNQITFSLPLDVEHINVPLDSEIRIEFSEAVEASSLATGLTLVQETDSIPVEFKLTVNTDSNVASLRPLSAFTDSSIYRLTIANTIVDRDNHALQNAPLIERLRTVDLTPPGPIDPGLIEASVPDDNGEVTVTGTLGTVEPEDTLIVLNQNTGFTVVAPVAPDGSFIVQIPAEIHHQLSLIQYDQDGNETTIEVAAFVRRDPMTGEVISVVVGRKGGSVHGPDNIKLEVPAGAVRGATELSIDKVSEAFVLPEDIVSDPVLFAAFESEYSVVERISITARAQLFHSPLVLSLPAPVGSQAGDRFIVVRIRSVAVGGPLADLESVSGLTAAENPLRFVQRLEIVETATVKQQGSELLLSTDSPPFTGILEPGIFSVLSVNSPLTFMAGTVRRESNTGSVITGATVQSIPRATVTSAFASVTDSDGKFVVADANAAGPYTDGALVTSRLDVFDPTYNRTIRRDVRGVIGPPAPPSSDIAHLEQPYLLPSKLPGAIMNVLGDIDPPSINIVVAGSSLSRGYALVGDALRIKVDVQDNDQVSFVGLEIDEGAGYDSRPLNVGGIYQFSPSQAGPIKFKAQARDRSSNTTFSERNLQILIRDVDGGISPPTSDPTRPPGVIEPGDDPDVLNPEDPSPEPVIPDAYEISFDGDIVILLSEPLDASTVNDTTVELFDPEGAKPDIEVSTEFGDSAIRITPKRNLRFKAEYTVKLSSQILDLDGQNLPAINMNFQCPGPEQIATIVLPNAKDVALIDQIEIDDDTVMEDVLVAVNYPLGVDEPGEIHAYQMRDTEDSSILLEEPILLGSAKTFGNPWSIAVEGDRVYVGNQYRGPIVFKEPSLSYSTELYGVFQLGTGIFHEGLSPNINYRWDSELPFPPSNLEVFDLSDPRNPTSLSTTLANFGRFFTSIDPLWDPNVLPTRVEITEQGVAMMNHLENIELFTTDLQPELGIKPESLGVVDNIWGPGVAAGRCDGGREEGQACPYNYNPPFWRCLDDARCAKSDEFYDAAYWGTNAIMLERDAVRIMSMEKINDPTLGNTTLAVIPLANARWGRVGVVQEFEWKDAEDTIQISDLAFVTTPRDKMLRIYDVSDPRDVTAPVAELANTFGNLSFDECAGIAYLHGGGGEFHVVDFNDPKKPIELNNPGASKQPFAVSGLGSTASFNGNTVSDSVVYLAEEAGVGVINARLCASPIFQAAPLQISALDNFQLQVADEELPLEPISADRCLSFKVKHKWRNVCRAVDLAVLNHKDKPIYKTMLTKNKFGWILDEKREDEIGGIMLVNNDDTNDNGIIDALDETIIKRIRLRHEKDVTAIRLIVSKRLKRAKYESAEVTLSSVNSVGLKFYEVRGNFRSNKRGLKLIDKMPVTWPIKKMPEYVYISAETKSLTKKDHLLTLKVDLKGPEGSSESKYLAEDILPITAVEVKLEPIIKDQLGNGDYYNPSGAVVGAEINFKVELDIVESVDDNNIKWQTGKISTGIVSPPMKLGSEVKFLATHPGDVRLRVDINGFTNQPPRLDFKVFPKEEIIDVHIYNVCNWDLFSDDCAVDPSDLSGFLDDVFNNTKYGVNAYFRQVGMIFEPIKSHKHMSEDIAIKNGKADGEYLSVDSKEEMLQIVKSVDGLVPSEPDRGVYEVYLVSEMKRYAGVTFPDYTATIIGKSLVKTFRPNKKEDGIILAVADPSDEIFRMLVASTLAHEFGHAAHLADIYESDPCSSLENDEARNKCIEEAPEIERLVRKKWLPQDWSYGSGTQFYKSDLKHSDLIRRLLMRGFRSIDRGDIPLGWVYGWSAYGHKDNVPVGIKLYDGGDLMQRRPRSR